MCQFACWMSPRIDDLLYVSLSLSQLLLSISISASSALLSLHLHILTSFSSFQAFAGAVPLMYITTLWCVHVHHFHVVCSCTSLPRGLSCTSLPHGVFIDITILWCVHVHHYPVMCLCTSLTRSVFMYITTLWCVHVHHFLMFFDILLETSDPIPYIIIYNNVSQHAKHTEWTVNN